MSKSITLRGREYPREQWPLICSPLVGKSHDELLAEAELLKTKTPDMVEWRIDFFDELEQTSRVLTVLQQLRELLGDIPLLITRRSIKEGGEAIPLNEQQVLDLYLSIVDSGLADAVDYEIALDVSYWQTLTAACQRCNVLLIGSYHNFSETPDSTFLLNKLQQAKAQGADIAKAAVMPQSKADLLTLFQATEVADRQLDIPVITMSMAALGLPSRLIGSVFGSCLTFAVGSQVSAPGQVPIEDVKATVAVIQKYFQAS